MRKITCLIFFFFLCANLYPERLLVYMDETQTDHLRAYGLVYWALSTGHNSEWLLNYRDGSFVIDSSDKVKEKANLMGVSFLLVDDSELTGIYQTIEENNMSRIYLNKAPKVAIYAPPFTDPWDDAVRLVLDYAQIPYTRVWDKEVLLGDLENYDWLHLHHEDFTGQYGKFYASFRNSEWYRMQEAKIKQAARELGFPSVAENKRSAAKMIQGYVSKGGFLFAMCSAVDTTDIALSSDGLNIVPPQIGGEPITPNAQEKLDFSKAFSFENFKLIFDPNVYEYSDIDIDVIKEGLYNNPGVFNLFDFSCKIDPVPSMLVQCHKNVIKDFLGQTTAFHKNLIKENVTILGETTGADRVKYIHGELGKGTFTFLGGHDPEDYQHLVGDPATDLSLHKNSPGYRLILNNVLYPAARKKPQKT